MVEVSAPVILGLIALFVTLFAMAAVDSNALTLAQYAMMSNDPLTQRVTMSLLDQDSVLNDIPLITNPVMKAKGVRFKGDILPTVNWAKVNEEPPVVNAVPQDYEEQVYLIRNAIDTDNLLVEDRNQIVDPRAVRLEAYLKSVRLDFTDKFINNNHLTGDADAIVGLRARLDNPALYGCESELKINGGGVDLTQNAMTAATANNFLELVDQLLSYMDAPTGDGVVIYMNDTLKRRFARAIRTLGAGSGFDTQRDAFDRTVDRYKNAVIRDAGRKKDQSTRVITSTEDSAGVDGASTYTSLYAVRYGETYMSGWQFMPLEQSVRNLGLINNGVTWRTVVDYAVGLFQVHTRAVGRIYGIKLS